MKSLRNAVLSKPVFEKVAKYELPSDISLWNDEIMKKFYEEIPGLPHEYGVDVVVASVDENSGYAKGSVVVFNNNTKINFPIIVKDFKLSPFDIFVIYNDDVPTFFSASGANVKLALSSPSFGKLENIWDSRGSVDDLKRPGNINPKSHSSNVASESEFSKMSHCKRFASNEDILKIASTLKENPEILESFVDNTNDLIYNIINVGDRRAECHIVPNDHKNKVLDVGDVIKSKRAITVIDSELTDVNEMKQITAPSVCELRMYQYPSIESFMESGYNMSDRFMATKRGLPVNGLLLPVVDSYEISSPDVCDLNRKHEVFLSLDGKIVAYGYNSGFYGTNIFDTGDLIDKAFSMIAKNTTDFAITPPDIKHGRDKLFAAVEAPYQDRYQITGSCNTSGDTLVIYGHNNTYECVKFHGKFKRILVEDTLVYVCYERGFAIVPSNVASVQIVSGVKDPVWKMAIGSIDNVYLIPESSTIINTQRMATLSNSDFLSPSKPLRELYKQSNLSRVSLSVDTINGGYHIYGDAIEPLKKIASIQNDPMSTDETISALMILGLDKSASEEAMKIAVCRAGNNRLSDKSVDIFGVNDDYINESVFDSMEKSASICNTLKSVAESIRIDLVKEASALEDPEAVDVVLSLNFINEDNLRDYIKAIPEMKAMSSRIAELIIASRMGLTEINEDATKKALDGLTDVISSLEDVKMAMGA